MAEHWVITRLLEFGFNVAIPVLDDGSDLWVETAEGVRRIQVKLAGEKRKGRSVRYRIQAGGSVRSGYRKLSDYVGHVEVLVAVHPNLRDCWVLTPEMLQHCACNHHLRPQDANRWDRIGEPRNPQPRSDIPETVEQFELLSRDSDA